MKRAITYVLAILLAAAAGYWVGWLRGSFHMVSSSTLSEGLTHLLVARHLRANKPKDALNFSESRIRGALTTFDLYGKKLPKDFHEGRDKLRSYAERYDREFPGSKVLVPLVSKDGKPQP
jgi:hypothetical protein